MEELQTTERLLPDTIDDLVKYDKIYSATQKTYRELLHSVKDWQEATDEEKRILKRAQDEADYLIDVRAKIGEFTARIPKASGGDRKSDSFKNRNSANFEKTKKQELSERGIDKDTASRYEALAKEENKPIIEKVKAEAREHNELVTQTQILKEIKKAQKEKEIAEAKEQIKAERAEGDKPILIVGNGIGFTPNEKYDLLLTDPPYSTDIDDIDAFVDDWLFTALEGVKETGFAYVFIGAYPEELRAYLNAEIPSYMTLKQVLIWTYKNTLGNNPKDRYKLNYQACLFYRGINAPDLNCPMTSEQWAVQEINAPDGRQGDRYHTWQKPSEIADRFIRHSTKQGMTVFDPFACTGTFLLSASKLGRKAYGFEIDPDNAKIAFERGCERERCGFAGHERE